MGEWTVKMAGRLDDMSHGKLSLRIEIQHDNDIVVCIDEDGVPIQDAMGNKAQVEFCCTGSGGGRSHHTRKALGELFRAMKLDAKETGEGVPPFPFMLAKMMEE